MLGKDLGYAARTLRKSPVFAVAAIVTIALGIGASTAIFSVTNAVLLRPLPYANPDRLVLAWQDLRRRNVADFPLSNADFFDLRKNVTMFEGVAGLNTGRGVFPAEDGTPEQTRFGGATTNLFGLLGAKIALGRDFVEADGVPQPPPPPLGSGVQPAPRLPNAAILSYEFWQRRYGGNPNILGRKVGGSVVVGVLAPGFELLFPPTANVERTPEIWTAMRLAYDEANRNNFGIRVIGRLKDGATLDQAQQQASQLSEDLRQRFVIKATSGFNIRLEPMHKNMVAEVRPAILALMGAVIFLLLIACANVANLILVRSSLRERELV